MTKTELIKEVARKTGFKIDDIKACVSAINETKIEALVAGEKVTDGAFMHDVRISSARKGRNPRTGEQIDIPEKKRVYTKAVSAVSNRVNQ